MGGSSTHTTSQKYDGVIVQSSLKGIAVPKGWGTFQTGCNLIDYLDFNSKKVSTSGKGGGAQPSYDYYATLVLAICLGPIFGVRTIYEDSAYYIANGGGSKEVNGTTITISSKTPVQAAGLTQLFLGAANQTPWTYLSSAHPADALGYSGLAYVAAENFSLNTSATSPNFNFEVQSLIRGTVSGVTVDDANPADIVNDLLPDVPRWLAGAIGNLTAYQTYCYAQGLLLSPVASGGRQASDLLTEIMTCSNSDCFMSEGLFQVVPMGDIEIAANGVTYTPDLTPIYSLTWDDIIPNSDGEDPFQWDIKPADECYNYVVVGFLDRSQQYASDSVPAIDQAAYNTFGPVRADAVSYDSICDAGVAATVAQLYVQRAANVRRTAKVVVSELFGLLDPLDLIEIPDMTGAPVLVRINETNEQEDGSIELDVEEMLVGTSHAPLYTRQDALGIPSNFAIDPGDSVAPTIINPPASLTGGQYEVWIASAGGPQWGGAVVWVSLDGDEFYEQGTISQPGRFGVTTNDLPATADPDTSDTLGVNLVASGGELTTATQAAADAQTTLCAVGTEVIAYSAATLTGANTYNLGTYIRRGLEGTTVADQPAGSLFLRLDEAVAVIPYNAGQIGKPLYIKLQSFNLYGNGYQDLDLCETYEFTAQANGTNVGDVTWLSIAGIPQDVLDYVASGGVANSTAHVQPTAEIGDSGLTADQVTAALAAAQANLATADQDIATLQGDVSGLQGEDDGEAAAAEAAASAAETAEGLAQNAAGEANTALSAAEGYADSAETQAGIATDAAGQAQGYATSASQSEQAAGSSATSAGLSASSAQESQQSALVTAASLLPGDFSQEGAFWTADIYTYTGARQLTTATWSDISFPTVAGYGVVVQTDLPSRAIGTMGMLRLAGGSTYNLHLGTRSVSAASPQAATFGLACFDASGEVLGYFLLLYQILNQDGTYQGFDATFTPGLIQASYPTVVFVRPIFVANTGPSGGLVGVQQVARFQLSDITDSTAAAGYASAASTAESGAQAAEDSAGDYSSTAQSAETNATEAESNAGYYASASSGSASTATSEANDSSSSASSAESFAGQAEAAYNGAETQAGYAQSYAATASEQAAAAESYATISANVGGGMLNADPSFAIYSHSTGLPDLWGGYGDASSGGGCTRVQGVISPNAVEIAAGAGETYIGVQSSQISAVPNSYWVIEAEITLLSGTLSGAGVFMQQFVGGSTGSFSAGTSVASIGIDFETDPDSSNTVRGNGSVGATYIFSKFVQLESSQGGDHVNIVACAHHAGIGDCSQANSIAFQKVGFRAASSAEIQGDAGTGDTANLTSELSSFQSAQTSQNSTFATDIGNAQSTANDASSDAQLALTTTADLQGAVTSMVKITVGAGNQIVSLEVLAADGTSTPLDAIVASTPIFQIVGPNGEKLFTADATTGQVSLTNTFIDGNLVVSGTIDTEQLVGGAVSEMQYATTVYSTPMTVPTLSSSSPPSSGSTGSGGGGGGGRGGGGVQE